jgi:hypothetical protein
MHALVCGLLLLASAIAAKGQDFSASGGNKNARGEKSAPARAKIGIFGFGSLVADPGDELLNATAIRLETETPFAVEYAHSSTRTRGGAPTLVPVTKGGAKVKATIFVLEGSISQQEAANILWRRETRQIGSKKSYKRPKKPNASSVLVAEHANFMGLDKILYTDFPDSGKLDNPTAKQLAELALASARNPEVPDGRDGISYLMAAKKAGVKTPLSADYEREILRMTGTASLEEALAKVRGAPKQK